MNKIYITSFSQGRENLEHMADALKQYNPVYLGRYPGATAMIPKTILNPSPHCQRWGFEDLTGLLEFLKDEYIYVYEVVGENISEVAFGLRKQLGLRRPGPDRVHLARTPKELAVVEFAKDHNSQETMEYILEHFTKEDLKA
jgi:hypothetical protein